MDHSTLTAFMTEAIAEGRIGVEAGHGGPFGSLIVQLSDTAEPVVVGRGHNRVVIDNDPTAHGEMVAIRAATSKLGRFDLSDCVLFTSCEPCPMCLGAIYWARLRKVYFAATRQDAADIGFDDLHIYNELPLALDQRALPFEALQRSDALALFNEWQSKSDKTRY